MSIINSTINIVTGILLIGSLSACNIGEDVIDTNSDNDVDSNSDIDNSNLGNSTIGDTSTNTSINTSDDAWVSSQEGDSDSSIQDSEPSIQDSESPDSDSGGEDTSEGESNNDSEIEQDTVVEDSEKSSEEDTSETSSNDIDSDTEQTDTQTGIGTIEDYGASGPFSDAKMYTNVGPNSAYTLFRPDATLGQEGFKHPMVAWGNGITTTPPMYETMLTLIATHGFVIIATNSTQPEKDLLVTGLDWLVSQNESGEMAGKLDTSREATIGYSWGGGAAIDAADRPSVLCTASLHGMPPRGDTAFEDMHAPLLLTTSTGDNFVTASEYVTPNYTDSLVQTFYGTLNDDSAGHLYIVEQNSTSAALCAGGGLLGSTFGQCAGAPEEVALLVAWLRLWVYGDENGKEFFYGDDCTLCKDPWTNPQRKNWPNSN